MEILWKWDCAFADRRMAGTGAGWGGKSLYCCSLALYRRKEGAVDGLAWPRVLWCGNIDISSSWASFYDCPLSWQGGLVAWRTTASSPECWAGQSNRSLGSALGFDGTMIINQGENTLQAANFVPPSVLNSNLKAINRKMMKTLPLPRRRSSDSEYYCGKVSFFLPFFGYKRKSMDERVFFTEEEDTKSKNLSSVLTLRERDGGQKKLMRKVPCGGFFFQPEMMSFLSHNIEGPEEDCDDMLKVAQTRFFE